MANDLEKKIIRQIEYYFGDINLSRDKFLQEKIKEDEGWVTLETLLTFNRLASITKDPEIIASAMKKSEANLVEVSEDLKKVRRNPEKPLKESYQELQKELTVRTAYAKGFPLDATLNEIIEFLDQYGPIDSCIRRTTKDQKFKGSCFIIFNTIELCKKFVEAESVKYKDTELLRKFQQTYFDDKKKEIQERKNAKKLKAEAAEEKPVILPNHAIIHFSGLPEGNSVSREELKEKFKEVGGFDVAYMDFNRGELEGYARVTAETEATEFVKKLADGEMEFGEQKLKLRILEGEEKEQFIKKSSDSIAKYRQKAKLNRKRKGNFGGHNGKKKQRN